VDSHDYRLTLRSALWRFAACLCRIKPRCYWYGYDRSCWGELLRASTYLDVTAGLMLRKSLKMAGSKGPNRIRPPRWGCCLFKVLATTGYWARACYRLNLRVANTALVVCYCSWTRALVLKLAMKVLCCSLITAGSRGKALTLELLDILTGYSSSGDGGSWCIRLLIRYLHMNEIFEICFSRQILLYYKTDSAIVINSWNLNINVFPHFLNLIHHILKRRLAKRN
jgi:hypothetical protein